MTSVTQRGGFRGVRQISTQVADTEGKPHDVFEFQEDDDDSKTKKTTPPRLGLPAVAQQPEVPAKEEQQPEQQQPAAETDQLSLRGAASVGRGRGRAAKALAVSQLAAAAAAGTKLTILSIASTPPVTVSASSLPSPVAVAASPTMQQQPRPDLAISTSQPSPPVRLSTEEKLSPSLVSPGGSSASAKSPKPRMRRSTGGKSRESEEESAETDQKIKLILEQAKQEAERTAAAHNLVQVAAGSAGDSNGVAGSFALAAGLPVAAVPVTTTTVAAQLVVTEQKALQLQRPSSSLQQQPSTVTLVAASAAPLNLAEPARNTTVGQQPRSLQRTGIPQPTVLPPRHDQQMRPQAAAVSTTSSMAATVATVTAAATSRVVPTSARPVSNLSPVMVTSASRHVLPIQLPTQPLPPESVRKTQPVLLEQNQPAAKLVPAATGASVGGMMPRTTLAVSLPTEPIPRSVAMMPGISVCGGVGSGGSNSNAASLPRSPLPVATAAHLAAVTRASLPLVVSSGSRHMVPGAVVVTRSALLPQQQHQARTALLHAAEGQRVSLKQRDGLKESSDLDLKMREQVAVEAMLSGAQGQPLKREYLQPRERDAIRPPSTPLMDHGRPKEEEKPFYPAHQQPQQYSAQTIELYKLHELQSYHRELTHIYQQLLAAGHTEAMAAQTAQALMRERERYMEEPRPGSVPPLSHLHHMEELRRQQQQQAASRQPMPAHSGDPYRQTESPLYSHLQPAHSQHPYMQQREPVGPPTAAHMEYRREDLLPPAAHSSQLQRLTHSPAISDFSTSRPQSPAAAATYQLAQQPLYTSGSASVVNTDMPLTNYRLPYLAAYPICWSGTLALKNDMANVRMHYVSGSRDLAKASLPLSGATLKIVQRMRLEDAQIDGVKRKMDTKSEHCMLLALPNGSDQEEIEKQSKMLRNNFITYLQLKSAAGIVNVSNEDNQPAYIVHVFPSCDFANENLARIAPNLLDRVADIEHLVIVIATVFNDVSK